MQAKDQYRIDTYDPDSLINAVTLHLGVANDSKLAVALDIDPAVISKIRTKALGLSASILIRMHDATRIPINELRQLAGLPIVEALVPAEV